jgi:hypothetical protein
MTRCAQGEKTALAPKRELNAQNSAFYPAQTGRMSVGFLPEQLGHSFPGAANARLCAAPGETSISEAAAEMSQDDRQSSGDALSSNAPPKGDRSVSAGFTPEVFCSYQSFTFTPA